MPTLQELGWNAFLEQQLNARFEIARVIEERKERYILAGESGDFPAEVSGRLRHEARSRQDFPAVGDWVLAQRPDLKHVESPALVQRVLERLTKLSRKVPGREQEEQILASNVDAVFITTSLNKDLNPRRIERTLMLAKESGAQPVIVLTKADLCENRDDASRSILEIARGIEVLCVSAREGTGLDALRGYIAKGQTAVLLGSSGVGKSTLVNALLGREVLSAGAIREDDDRGRHTTSHRQLLNIPNGGMIIDTPGLRELQLWAGTEALDETFEDIVELSRQCRFKDCEHKSEPGCAVLAAKDSGQLDSGRWENFLKLKKELAYATRRESKSAAAEEKKKWRAIHRTAFDHIRNKRRIDL